MLLTFSNSPAKHRKDEKNNNTDFGDVRRNGFRRRRGRSDKDKERQCADKDHRKLFQGIEKAESQRQSD